MNKKMGNKRKYLGLLFYRFSLFREACYLWFSALLLQNKVFVINSFIYLKIRFFLQIVLAQKKKKTAFLQNFLQVQNKVFVSVAESQRLYKTKFLSATLKAKGYTKRSFVKATLKAFQLRLSPTAKGCTKQSFVRSFVQPVSKTDCESSINTQLLKI